MDSQTIDELEALAIRAILANPRLRQMYEVGDLTNQAVEIMLTADVAPKWAMRRAVRHLLGNGMTSRSSGPRPMRKTNPETVDYYDSTDPMNIELTMEVEDVLDTMSPEYSEVLRLTMQGFTVTEVADLTGNPRSTMARTIERAKELFEGKWNA